MNTSTFRNFARRSLLLAARAVAAVLILAMILGYTAQSQPAAAGDDPWRDEFDTTLQEGWEWYGADPPQWSLETKDGTTVLRMTASQTLARNMLLRSVADGDFSITTRLFFMPNTNFQFAGLVIYQDDENFLQFGRAYCDLEGVCAGDGLYFDAVLGGELAGGNFATALNPGDVYLRLERRGNMIRAFYSLDAGISWIIVGDHWVADGFDVNKVGITASQDFSGIGITADFDFFMLSEGGGFLPEGYHDYDQGDVPSWACNAGGWAADPDDRSARLNVEIVVDDQTVANLTASEFRQDLLDAGVCTDGNCGFSTSLWDVIPSYEPHTVATWAQDATSGEWVLLYNSNKPLTCRTYDIYIYDTVNETTELLAALPETDEYNPGWSANGRFVSFDTVGADVPNINITNIVTGITMPLRGSDGGNDSVWSPTGSLIAYDRLNAGDPSIYIQIYMQVGNGIARRLLRRNAISPSWAPNGLRLAFQDMNTGQIRTMGLIGKYETVVVDYGMHPAWSPDGNWIAYERDGEIWKIAVNAQGQVLGEPTPVTHLIPAAGQPTWSADSQSIVFHSGQTQDYDLWTIQADGINPHWLTGAPNFGDYDPAYSFDGRYIAYASFSPDGQAARQWVSAFSSDQPIGFWTPGMHTYRYEWVYALPEPGTVVADYEREFNVSYNAPRYDGYVLLRGQRLHGYFTDEGLVCDPTDAVNPDQATRLLNGWLSENPMTYAEVTTQLPNITGRTIIDESMEVILTPHEIQSWTSLDWGGYVCTSSLGPPKMDLRVNYGHDWVESFYEGGHQVEVTVTDVDGKVKATASVVTEPKDWWGYQTGFATTPGDWTPSQPDIQPGDWVYATVDNGATAMVQIGDIQGVVDSVTDNITGVINVPGVTIPVQVECLDWGSGSDPPFDNIDAGFIAPDGSGSYTCLWGADRAWDILPWQDIGVGYFTPGGHWVANAFRDERWMAFWTFDPDIGFLGEGLHTYWFHWEYTVPWLDSDTTPEKSVNVSSSVSPPYPGKVLLWTYEPLAWTGESCTPISDILPDQDVRFVMGWVNDFSMTYDEALAHFNSFTVTAFWDGIPATPDPLLMGELMPWTGRDARMAYVCTLTGNP